MADLLTNDKGFSVRWTRGRGKGGQHRNKTTNCCVLTHVPTGLSVTIDGRSRMQNYKAAMKALRELLEKRREAACVAVKKRRRDRVIHDHTRVRTYDFDRGIVIDHRTKKTASLKDVLMKGLLDKLR